MQEGKGNNCSGLFSFKVKSLNWKKSMHVLEVISNYLIDNCHPGLMLGYFGCLTIFIQIEKLIYWEKKYNFLHFRFFYTTHADTCHFFQMW